MKPLFRSLTSVVPAAARQSTRTLLGVGIMALRTLNVPATGITQEPRNVKARCIALPSQTTGGRDAALG
jgi:hypothetical protein